MKADIILAGSPRIAVQGQLLVLPEPVSFWGGVDASTGVIIDGNSSRHGRSIAHTVLALFELRGSSSTSAVLLELIYRNLAPVAILSAEIDAILVLGAIAGREMGWPTPAIARISESSLLNLQDGSPAEIDPAGHINLRSSSGK